MPLNIVFWRPSKLVSTKTLFQKALLPPSREVRSALAFALPKFSCSRGLLGIPSQQLLQTCHTSSPMEKFPLEAMPQLSRLGLKIPRECAQAITNELENEKRSYLQKDYIAQPLRGSHAEVRERRELEGCSLEDFKRKRERESSSWRSRSLVRL